MYGRFWVITEGFYGPRFKFVEQPYALPTARDRHDIAFFQVGIGGGGDARRLIARRSSDAWHVPQRQQIVDRNPLGWSRSAPTGTVLNGRAPTEAGKQA
jgi:hypothetical protein